ncbi:unnamed protein product [Ectocarpus sp. 6 AP-2014]
MLVDKKTAQRESSSTSPGGSSTQRTWKSRHTMLICFEAGMSDDFLFSQAWTKRTKQTQKQTIYTRSKDETRRARQGRGRKQQTIKHPNIDISHSTRASTFKKHFDEKETR